MSRLGTGYHLYQNNSDGRYWAILKSGPNRFIYTRYSYESPLLALKRLTYRQNSNLMATGTSQEINHWIYTTPVKKVNIRGFVKTNNNNNFNSHWRAAGTLYKMSRK